MTVNRFKHIVPAIPLAATFRQVLNVIGALGLALVLVMDVAAAQRKSDTTFANDVDQYITENNLRDEAPDAGGRAAKSALPVPDDAPSRQGRMRPRVPSGAADFPSYNLENKQRALRALDDVILQDALRERRFTIP